ncbi:MAG TPA: cell division protein ZapB [Methylomirabilota bacterium]|jgi:FtsZ-binding cell division protein ZapB|nr:cell division protein ZapB [Methylomirabilota bacterium]
MAEAGERLALLEQRVQRAIELIERLRVDNARLGAERSELAERVEALGREMAALRQREQALVRLEGEHRRLQEERQALLGHVEGMLKELARIEAS